MKKEFFPYEQSLELKEIGFDEKCFGYHYTLDGKNWKFAYSEEFRRIDDELNIGPKFMLLSPTFSQAFRWFREKYNIAHSIDWMTRSGGGGEYPSGYIVHFRGINGNILNEDNLIVLNNTEFPGYEVFPTYEEVELACLKKLIELVKNK